MNIFCTDNDPIKSAENLDDKRVVKMILECAQMLSTAMHEVGAPGPPYKKTHVNHPCSIWARTTSENYRWLLEHMAALCIEYSDRYPGRTHKCEQLIAIFDEATEYIPAGGLTPFPNCTIYKENADTIQAYRDFMVHKWDNDKRKPTWYGSDERPF